MKPIIVEFLNRIIHYFQIKAVIEVGDLIRMRAVPATEELNITEEVSDVVHVSVVPTTPNLNIREEVCKITGVKSGFAYKDASDDTLRCWLKLYSTYDREPFSISVDLELKDSQEMTDPMKAVVTLGAKTSWFGQGKDKEHFFLESFQEKENFSLVFQTGYVKIIIDLYIPLLPTR